MSAAITATRFTFAIDCPDAVALASFYAGLLGWRIVRDADSVDWVEARAEGATHGLAFQRVDNYRAPDWPDGAIPQQAHLDVYVADLAESSASAIAAGATRHPVQPSEEGTFVVFTDPAGHPFCLCVEGD